MAFDGVIFGLIVGFMRRGSLRGFMDIRLMYGWMFPILLAVQFLVYWLQNKYAWAASASTYTFLSVYVVGLFFLWLNRKETGFPLLLAGVFLNFLVMLVNGGRMPVSVEAASVLDASYVDSLKQGLLYGKHAMLTGQTKLAFLGDIIPLTKPYYKEQVISIGDVIIGIGIFLYIQKVMLSGRTTASSAQPVEQI